LLLKSHVTLDRALSIVSGTTTNLVYKESVSGMREMVNQGQEISAYLKNHNNIFPEVISQMVSVGEKSGSLSDSLVYVSEFYDQELSELTRNLSSLIEPALMIFMGLVIGFIAISIITPIYSLTQGLHP
jgi:type IV pilus assembly protein PilC